MRGLILGDRVFVMNPMTSLKPGFQVLLALALASCMQMAAAETAATVTRSANVRSAPHASFPTVTWLLTGTRVTVLGCTPNWGWCDIVSGRTRGWMYSRYLSVAFEGSAVTIRNGGPNLGLPVTEFALGPYWDEHFQRQHWFSQKASWQARWDGTRAPPDWRPPSRSR